MRPEENPLDLNNLPEDHGKQPIEESSMTTAASTDTIRFKKKKSGGKDEGKIYECRFCSLKFYKSQALGGHMNRHRQERETETLNRARQLVFRSEGLAGAGDHIGCGDFNMGLSQGFQPRGGGIGDPCLQFRSVCPRLPTQTSPQPPLPPCNIYPSSSSYPRPHPPIGEYFVGHVLSNTSQWPMNRQNYGTLDSNYTCFGEPLTHGFPIDGVRAPMAREEGGSSNQEERRDWS